MATIGFVGMGHMGLPMALNLKKAGHNVVVYDVLPKAMEKAAEQGLKTTQSLIETAKDKDFFITMLPEGKHVRAVYLGEDKLLETISSSTFLIDCSTIDVETARDVAKQSSTHGFRMIDAPVSGGVPAAKAGTLTFMVGGDKKDFTQAHPLFEIMGKNIFHTGGHGNGQLTKICNNLMLAAEMIITSEAFVLAEKLGLDKEKLFEVVSVSSGQSWSLTSYCPAPGLVDTAPSNRDYKAGFAAAMMLKDLGLAESAAEMSGLDLPLCQESQRIYQDFCDQGQSQLDFSGIIKAYQKIK